MTTSDVRASSLGLPNEETLHHKDSSLSPNNATESVPSEFSNNRQDSAARRPSYGGPFGTGSPFRLSDDELQRLEKREVHYKNVVQKVLDRADIKLNGDRPFDLVVHNPMLYRSVLRKGSLGLGIAFMDGWCDTRDFYALDQFFSRILRSDLEYYFPNNAKDFAHIVKARLFNPQTKKRSKRVGLQHYDTGNAFFRNMLGPTMQYSCAFWQRHTADGVVQRITTLDEAQETKLRMIGDKLRLRPGMEVLDVGCGWGTLAAFLSETYKVKVTGITISEEQRRAAAQRVWDNPNVTILMQDYRDLKFCKKFDRIVSVGMFEHVGPKNYKVFFKHMRRLLRDDDDEAVFLLHTIGSNTTMTGADPWYLKFIFPGGCLPSIAGIGKNIEGRFVMEDWHNFSYFYGLTLMAWRENFLRGWSGSPESRQQDADQFFRMFYYYLSSSAGAFFARDLQLWQIVLSPKGVRRYADVPRP